MPGVFIDVEIDDSIRDDPELAKKLEDACPVDIFAASDGRVEVVEQNLDECVLCELCIKAAPPERSACASSTTEPRWSADKDGGAPAGGAPRRRGHRRLRMPQPGPVRVRVHALGDASDPVRRSRWCSEFVSTGSKEGAIERYLEWLETGGPRGAAVLPCDDYGVEMIARNRARLDEWGYLPG